MELVKNIFFNTDKLTPNSRVKISYTGKFFQDNSKDVYIHYGFGNEWTGLADEKMIKTELGFQIEVDLLDSSTFNFCLKNEKNEWDNNNGNNYIFIIERPETSLMVLSEMKKPTKGLRRSYLWSKKIRLAIYKMLIYIPRLISGNYKRKNKENE